MYVLSADFSPPQLDRASLGLLRAPAVCKPAEVSMRLQCSLPKLVATIPRELPEKMRLVLEFPEFKIKRTRQRNVMKTIIDPLPALLLKRIRR